MSKQELPKAYDFKSTEPRIYAMWETGGYFKPRSDPAPARLRPDGEALRHLHPAAERDRRTAPRPRHVRLASKT